MKCNSTFTWPIGARTKIIIYTRVQCAQTILCRIIRKTHNVPFIIIVACKIQNMCVYIVPLPAVAGGDPAKSGCARTDERAVQQQQCVRDEVHLNHYIIIDNTMPTKPARHTRCRFNARAYR